MLDLQRYRLKNSGGLGYFSIKPFNRIQTHTKSNNWAMALNLRTQQVHLIVHQS